MPKSGALFSGVQLIALKDYTDERGFFREVAKKSWKVSSIRQVSVSQTKPGIIKAFHWHERQNDAWHLLEGKILVGLHDLRKKSKTSGQTVSFEWDANTPCLLVIPKKVAHGYKVLGAQNAVMLYLMDTEYHSKKPDEKRLAFDDPKIQMDWNQKPAQSITDLLP